MNNASPRYRSTLTKTPQAVLQAPRSCEKAQRQLKSHERLPEITLRQAKRPCLVHSSSVTAPKDSLVHPAAAEFDESSLSASAGSPTPLGPSVSETSKPGINFAVFSQHASAVTLEIYHSNGASVQSFPLSRDSNRTGDIWHIALEGLPKSGVLYGYRVEGEGGWETGHRWDSSKVMLDPYAPLIAGRLQFAVRDEIEQFKPKDGSTFRGTYDFASPAFDWGADYQRPNHAPQDLIIYEMGVRSFTAHESSGLPAGQKGTYLGLKEKIPHLIELGITAVELLPVMEYDELEFQRTPNPRDHMVNIWGYSHISFLAPMSRFAADSGGPAAGARELKEAVKALHAAGIEVILDVVFNHTVEGGDDDPYLMSFRGLDNSVYYMLNLEEYHQLLNYSGCGNTVSGNHPVVKDLIIASCRRWVEEYHVDGFRFDLASALCRDPKGNPLEAPPLIRDIAKDPVLSKVKLFAEPWDCGGLYQVGSFPNWDIWGEWNGKFRDDTRRFIKGDGGMKAAFATRMAGSADLYNHNQRKPYHGINFVIAHDGFTLHDLVAYNEKHNDANGENNRDGSNDNFSWNCGAEGPIDAEQVLALRQRQMRNLMLALLIAQGTPMVLSGDEYAQSRGGNNNWYGHDTNMTRFEWDKLEVQRDSFFRFYSQLIHFRRKHPLLGQPSFLGPEDISWYDEDWNNPESRFLAFTLHDRVQGSGDLFVAFNAHAQSYSVNLPQLPDDKFWSRVVDTNLPPPKDFTIGGNKGVDAYYIVNAFSSILLMSKAK